MTRPATDFLADLHSGEFSLAQMRERFRGGTYPGLRGEWAREWVRLAQ